MDGKGFSSVNPQHSSASGARGGGLAAGPSWPPARLVVTSSKLAFSPPKRHGATKEEDEPAPVMEMKQFQAKEMIQFKQVVVGEGKVRELVIVNPSPESQDMGISRHAKNDKGLNVVTEMPLHFEPKEKKTIEIFWVPTKSGPYFDSIHFLTSDAHTLQVSLTGTAIARKPPVQRKAVVVNRPVVLASSNNNATVVKGKVAGVGQSRVVGVGQSTVVKKLSTIPKDASPRKRLSSGGQTFVRKQVVPKKSRMMPKVHVFAILEATPVKSSDLVNEIETVDDVTAMNKAATKIQATWRGYSERKTLMSQLMSELEQK